jgi:hypothetical protein
MIFISHLCASPIRRSAETSTTLHSHGTTQSQSIPHSLHSSSLVWRRLRGRDCFARRRRLSVCHFWSNARSVSNKQSRKAASRQHNRHNRLCPERPQCLNGRAIIFESSMLKNRSTAIGRKAWSCCGNEDEQSTGCKRHTVNVKRRLYK